MKPLRIIFMGTPDFTVPALDALRKAGHDIICVYTQPPRPKGRGQNVQPSAVQAYAETHNMPVRHPKSLKNPEDQHEFEDLDADVAVVAGYGMLLPQAILDAPKQGCINIHPSLLPRWRGTAPVQYAIWKGDARTGVCIMQLESKMDTGPVIAMRTIDMPTRATFQDLNPVLWALGAEMIAETIQKLASNGILSATPQSESGATYTKMLKKEDGFIDWSDTADNIDRQIRALTPWPGVSAQGEEGRIKILSAKPNSGAQAYEVPGSIINRDGDVICGQGTILRLDKIQPANTKAMDFAAALNGNYIKVGQVLK